MEIKQTSGDNPLKQLKDYALAQKKECQDDYVNAETELGRDTSAAMNMAYSFMITKIDELASASSPSPSSQEAGEAYVPIEIKDGCEMPANDQKIIAQTSYGVWDETFGGILKNNPSHYSIWLKKTTLSELLTPTKEEGK
jgi:hypothetical protein